MHAAQSAPQLRITLLQERSAGTFARVYLAEAAGEGGISRIVAVKVLKEQWAGSEELLARTRDEARLLARLHHKNILRVEAMAEIDGQPAIVMEFVDGVDLKQLTEILSAEGRRVPPRVVYRIALAAASALEAACFRVPYGGSEPLSVVHRDLKPSNVMISVEGEVKVLDFGTARFNHEARAARTGVMRFGSMKYMSPERRLGDRGEHASDVYGLGLLLMEMLRGEQLPLLPLELEEHDEALADMVPRLGELGLPNDEWEHSLRQMLLRMCHHDPAQRLDARQVAGLLRAFADQAEGPSLDSFAADTVERVARQVYGDGIEGSLSGSQVFVRMSNAGAGVGAEGAARPVAAAEPPAGATGPAATAGGVITRNGPSAGRGISRKAPPGGIILGAPGSVPLVDEPTMLQSDVDRTEPEVEPLAEMAGASAAGAPVAGLAQPGAGAEAPARPEPMEPPRSVRPTGHAGPDMGGATSQPAALQPTTFQSARREPPAEAGPGSDRKLLLVAAGAGLLAGVALLALVGAGLAGWWWVNHAPSEASASSDVLPSPFADQPAADQPVEPAAASGDGVTVSLRSDDDRVQWLKLMDADGQQVVKARPQGEAAVAPGRYRLAGKLVGRSRVDAEVDISGDAAWACAPTPEHAIRCTEPAGGTLLLEPR